MDDVKQTLKWRALGDKKLNNGTVRATTCGWSKILPQKQLTVNFFHNFGNSEQLQYCEVIGQLRSQDDFSPGRWKTVEERKQS